MGKDLSDEQVSSLREAFMQLREGFKHNTKSNVIRHWKWTFLHILNQFPAFVKLKKLTQYINQGIVIFRLCWNPQLVSTQLKKSSALL